MAAVVGGRWAGGSVSRRSVACPFSLVQGHMMGGDGGTLESRSALAGVCGGGFRNGGVGSVDRVVLLDRGAALRWYVVDRVDVGATGVVLQ